MTSCFVQLLQPIPAIKSAEEGGDDDAVASTASGTVQLHRVTDESGTLTTIEVTTSPLTKESLTMDDVYGEFLFISVRAM